MFAYSCGSDSNNPIVPVTPTPTHEDSIVKLINPVNNHSFITGQSMYFSWNKNVYSSYRIYFDTSAAFLQDQFTVISDSVFIISDTVGTESYSQFWKVVPYLNDTIRYEYSSEIRKFTVN